MKRRFISFLSAVVVAFMSFAQIPDNAIFSWVSPDGTVQEIGGTVVEVNGTDAAKPRVNYANGGYYTICLNGKKGNINDAAGATTATHALITLDQALQEGDSIYVTAYRNKGDESIKSSIYFLYENGTEVNDDTEYPDIAIEGQAPATHGYLVPTEAAGSKTIKLSRNSASTNLFITQFVIVRQAAEEDTPAEPELIVWTINQADYPEGEQYAKDEPHVINDALTIYTTDCHWRTDQLRVYSSATNNGFFYSNKLPAAIKSIEFTAGNKVDVLVVYGSNDGATWTEVAKVNVPATSYTSGLVADFTGTAYNYFKVDVEGTNQVRITNMVITLDPSVALPVIVSAPSFSLSGCNLFAPATVELTAAEGTIYWSTDNENFVAYTDAIAIDATCTIYAYAEVDGSKSAVASAEYVMATTYDNVAALLAAEATSAGVPVIVKLEATIDSLGLNKDGEVVSAFLVEGTNTLMIYDYNIPADYVVGNVVEGQLAGLWKDYKGTLELCNVDYSGATASIPLPPAPALDGTYFSVGTAATTLELEKWYLLKNQRRNAYINDLITELRMKGTGELTSVNSSDANKGLLFKLAAGSADGTYTIVSGNGNYFTIADSRSAVSATAVDYIIGNVAEGVFYMQDPATGVVADGNAAGGAFVGWGTTAPTSTGGNNCYQFMQVDFIDAAIAEPFVNAGNMLYDLQVAYGLVTDASQFSSNAAETKEGSLGALIDNQYSTFFHSAWSYNVEEAHHLQMEVSEPTESIFFYFKKRSQNDNNRPTDITILGSNDGKVFTEITTINSGLPTGASPLDYTSEVITASEAYKHFRFVVNATSTNTKFFTFSEFYLFPGSQTILDAIATSKALVEAGLGAENFDELKAAFEVAYNKVQEDKFNKLFNTAVADAEALLAAASHAEAPALGQYSTAAYTEFEAALATLKAEATQENLDAINAAVVKFEAAKCLPVFTINGVIDYAAGKSIYENAEGGLNFKATDLADEAMLWSFDMTETAVGVTEKVVVKNLATGNLFWGAPSIKVTETSDAVEGTDDGIFLFYTEGNGTPVHAQNNGQAVVRWSSTEATSGSAWAFTFVGTTYDLYDLDAPDWTDITAETITNADFASNVDGWTKTDAGFAYEARVAEFYSGWGSLENTSGSLLQEVTLPAGKYRLTGKAFFRQGESYGTNPAKSLGYMVAGDNKVLVKTLGSVEGLNAYANNRVEAANAFYTDGLYDNVLEFTLAEETTLNIGFETTFDEMRSWFIVGEVKLESAQPVPGALFPLFEEQAMAFCSYNNTAMYSLAGVLSRWEELANVVNEIYGAITSGEKVLDAKVVNTMDAMTDMLAELDKINKFYNEYNEIKFSCYDLQDNSVANTPEVAAAFEDVVSLAYNTAGIATLADLQTLADTLLYASRQYMLNAVPNEGYTFDYTFLIEGVGNSTDGWVNDVPGFSGNFVYKHSTEKDTETLKKNGFIEAWNPSAYTGTISYTKNELPNGYYKISAYAFTNGTTTFFANADSVIVENTSMYVQPVIDSVLVTDGTLKFGLAVENANWVGITNIELTFTAAIPDSILYGVQRDAFVARAQEFAAFVEGNASLTMLYGIKGTYAWPLFDVVDPLVTDIDNVTDMALLDSMTTAMDEATAAMNKAVVVYEEYNAVVSLFWDAADNSTALNQDVADARDLALTNSNYAGMNAATVEALEAAVVEIQNAYLAYVTNAIANEGYKFDVTFMLVNPSFETGDLTGWTIARESADTGVRTNSGNYATESIDGTHLFNSWWNGVLLSQEVVGLPNGKYTLTIAMAGGDAGNDATAYIIANTDTMGLNLGNPGVFVDYSLNVEVTSQKLYVATIGGNDDDTAENPIGSFNPDGYWWYKADNFRLYYAGVEKPAPKGPKVAYLCGATESTEAIYNALVAADCNVTALNYDNVVLNDSIVEADFVGKYDVVVLAGGTGSGTNLAKAFNTLLGKVPVLSTKAFWYAKTTPAGTNGDNPGTADNPSRFLVKTVAEHPIFGGIAGDTITVFNDMAKEKGRYLQQNGAFANNEPAQTTLGTANGADCIGEAWVGDMGWLIIPVDGAQPEGYLTEAGKALFVNAVAYLVAGEKYEAPVVEVATVTLDKTEAELTEAGATVQLTATVAPENAADKAITWTSSDEKVATVDANGLVTAVANGTATITATAANGVKAECVITVKIAVVDGIEAIEAVENAVIYTITGKAVQGDVKTLERGIYIINGKKVLVK